MGEEAKEWNDESKRTNTVSKERAPPAETNFHLASFRITLLKQ